MLVLFKDWDYKWMVYHIRQVEATLKYAIAVFEEHLWVGPEI